MRIEFFGLGTRSICNIKMLKQVQHDDVVWIFDTVTVSTTASP